MKIRILAIQTLTRYVFCASVLSSLITLEKTFFSWHSLKHEPCKNTFLMQEYQQSASHLQKPYLVELYLQWLTLIYYDIVSGAS